MRQRVIPTRRQVIVQGLALGGSALFVPGVFADLIQTPSMTEGPFYPDRMPLDTDNDLLIVNDGITPAVGEITHLSGRVLSSSGTPIRNAFVEIWQVDNNAVYLHSADRRPGTERDSNFQGYGRHLTDASGRYYFRTIKPVAYPGRTPHIHFAVSRNGHRILTTQLFVRGHEQNRRDGLLRGIRDEAALNSVMGDFQPIKDSKLGELAVNFDIVLGQTAFEDDEGKLRGVAPPEWRRRG